MATTKTSKMLAKLATAIDIIGEEAVEKTLTSLSLLKKSGKKPLPEPPPCNNTRRANSIFFPRNNKEKKELLVVAKTIATHLNCTDYRYVITGTGCVNASIGFHMMLYLGRFKIGCSQRQICKIFGLKSDGSFAYAQRKIRELRPDSPATSEYYLAFARIKQELKMF